MDLYLSDEWIYISDVYHDRPLIVGGRTP
jgi:hypothetical protein